MSGRAGRGGRSSGGQGATRGGTGGQGRGGQSGQGQSVVSSQAGRGGPSRGGQGARRGARGGQGRGGQSSQAIPLLQDTGIRRKFRIWVQRWLRKQKAINLSAGRKSGSQLEWLGQNSDYLAITQFGYNQSDRKHFAINISSLPYLGAIGKKLFQTTSNSEPLSQSLRHYYLTIGQKQLGKHLVVERHGFITSFDTQSTLNRAHVEYTIGGNCTYSVNSVYPVLRDEEDSNKEVFRLTLGMAFINDGNHNINGWNRHYYRCPRYGGIGVNPDAEGNTMFELTESELYDSFVQKNLGLGRRFALYVCAGAKLHVYDDYRPKLYANEAEEGHHNRSLVQQGGIVVCEGVLEFNVPSDYYKKENFSKMIQYNVLSGKRADKVKTFKGPVIFLGANESDYNSIAWSLNVHSKPRKGNRFLRTLTTPEGGYIVAIEDWDDGIEEIWSRHRYERLFESNIDAPDIPDGQPSYSQYGYEVPENDMICKILGAGQEEREFTIDLRALEDLCIDEEMSPKPKEFNFSRMDDNSKQVQKLMPPMPPLMPPILVRTDAEDLLYYLPNREIVCDERLMRFAALDEYESHYYALEYKFTDNKVFVPDRDDQGGLYYDIFELSSDWHQFQEYEWKRDTIESVQGESDLQRRYGVDGWIYKKTDQQIAQYMTRYYEYSRKMSVTFDAETGRVVEVVAEQAESRATAGSPANASESDGGGWKTVGSGKKEKKKSKTSAKSKYQNPKHKKH